ncbi:MAG TPA: hypothetical protein VF136_10960 [Methylomirabilota bacterium]
MNRRTLGIILLALLALAGGVVAYFQSSRPPAVAEDCEDNPPPQNEFAMAAECEGDAPAGPADPR